LALFNDLSKILEPFLREISNRILLLIWLSEKVEYKLSRINEGKGPHIHTSSNEEV
jgi:hypothetical protein